MGPPAAVTQQQHFVNSLQDVVAESLDGLVAATPHLRRLDGYPGVRHNHALSWVTLHPMQAADIRWLPMLTQACAAADQSGRGRHARWSTCGARLWYVSRLGCCTCLHCTLPPQTCLFPLQTCLLLSDHLDSAACASSPRTHDWRLASTSLSGARPHARCGLLADVIGGISLAQFRRRALYLQAEGPGTSRRTRATWGPAC